eukprot:6482247-Pyramimonas_sp.AAC.1
MDGEVRPQVGPRALSAWGSAKAPTEPRRNGEAQPRPTARDLGLLHRCRRRRRRRHPPARGGGEGRMKEKGGETAGTPLS